MPKWKVFNAFNVSVPALLHFNLINIKRWFLQQHPEAARLQPRDKPCLADLLGWKYYKSLWRYLEESTIKATNPVYKQAQRAPQTQPKAKDAGLKLSYCKKGKTKGERIKILKGQGHREIGGCSISSKSREQNWAVPAAGPKELARHKAKNLQPASFCSSAASLEHKWRGGSFLSPPSLSRILPE